MEAYRKHSCVKCWHGSCGRGWQEPPHFSGDQTASSLTLSVEVASWSTWTAEVVDSSKSLNVKHLPCHLVLGSGQQDSEKHIPKDTQRS